MNLDEKIEKVENTIKNRKIAIAFSGGADSTLLAYLASKVSDKPIAITIDNHIFPTGFIKHCKKTAKEFGIKHKVIDLNFYEHENLLSNKSDRCFVCRDLMYGNIKKYATDNGYESVLDGNNISDLVLDRPGILITYKNNIESPFIHAKLTSKEIHEYLNRHNIPFSRSTTCLGTRLPTNTKMTPENIKQVSESEDFIYEKTKALYIETLGNPNSDVVDIESVAKIAHKHKIPLVVDNTFATPYLVRPIEYGADIVVHSATKFIGGHGTSIGGVIVDGGNFDWEASGKFDSLTKPNPSYHGISFTQACGAAAFVTKVRAILLRDTGATVSPFNAFLFLQGLETLSLRVERHSYNALKVVEYLNNHPQVESVSHPSVSTDPKQQELYKKYFPNGGGSIFTFDIKGDAQKAKDFIDNLELFSLLANVADVKSLVIHPATTTHSQCTEEELLDQGIRPNTIRLSIGCENIDDIIQDLDEAFKAIA